MTVRHAILGLLAQRSAHGYDLHASFEALVGGRSNWDVKPAQVYTTLTRLEDAGLIAHTEVRRAGGPDQRIYEITDAGRDELAEWYGSGVHPSHLRDEFFVKLMLAAGDPEGDPARVVRVQRSALYRSLHELTARRTEADRRAGLAHAMLLDKAVMHIEADLRWLDMVEARLRDISSGPVPLPQRPRRGRPPKADAAITDTGPPG